MGLGVTERVKHYGGFLHDGRAIIIDEAILWHSGEPEDSKINIACEHGYFNPAVNVEILRKMSATFVLSKIWP